MAHLVVSRADSKTEYYGNADDRDEERSFIEKDRRRLDRITSERTRLKRNNPDNAIIPQYDALINELTTALPAKRAKKE